ncbi:MAG: hypothetical protein SPF93_07990, partial [Megasphaera elsdenii]|nr:hypothetical protein [Megasphaera elsdenii]
KNAMRLDLLVKASCKCLVCLRNPEVLVIHITIIHIEQILVQKFHQEPLLVFKRESFKIRSCGINICWIHLATNKPAFYHTFIDVLKHIYIGSGLYLIDKILIKWSYVKISDKLN